MTPRAKPLSPDDRRASIIAAARPVLEREGFGFTTRQVADAAGVAEGTLFRVFDSKRELVRAVVDDVLDPTETEAEIAALRPATLEDAVHELVVTLGARIRRTAAFFISARANNSGPRVRLKPTNGDGADETPPPRPDPDELLNDRNERLQRAIAELLRPFTDHLALSPERAADFLRVVIFSATDPFHAPTTTHFTPDELTRLVLHGCSKES